MHQLTPRRAPPLPGVRLDPNWTPAWKKKKGLQGDALQALVSIGARNRNRTYDLRITNRDLTVAGESAFGQKRTLGEA